VSAEYQARVAEFFSHGLNNLSAKSDENGTCEPFFSWRHCQCCGTHLAGDRYECDGYNGVTDEVEEYDCICGDCVYYAEYGQLDDMTMLEIEKSDE
jgi:hypothetical protein